jgi:hypothetical protein
MVAIECALEGAVPNVSHHPLYRSLPRILGRGGWVFGISPYWKRSNANSVLRGIPRGRTVFWGANVLDRLHYCDSILQIMFEPPVHRSDPSCTCMDSRTARSSCASKSQRDKRELKVSLGISYTVTEHEPWGSVHQRSRICLLSSRKSSSRLLFMANNHSFRGRDHIFRKEPLIIDCTETSEKTRKELSTISTELHRLFPYHRSQPGTFEHS